MFNVLLVDDLQMQNDLLKQRIDCCGLEINYFTANNGYEGLDIFRRELIDLVIMDHVMPIMDGIESLKQMRLINREIPIFMSSGSCHNCDCECLQFGATKILPKPISMELLINSVMEELRPDRHIYQR